MNCVYNKEECNLIAALEYSILKQKYRKLRHNPTRFKKFLCGSYHKVGDHTYCSAYCNGIGYKGTFFLNTNCCKLLLTTEHSGGMVSVDENFCRFVEEVMNYD